MHRTTAWKIARAYADATRRPEDEAYGAIIVEST
jgi:hypothetical protein